MYRLISVIGGNQASSREKEFARKLGSLLASGGYSVVCGGGDGVMEAVAQGCHSVNGVSIGILPGDDPKDANRFISIPLPTGLGVSRNRLVVLAGEVVCAVGGATGTLSEIAFALQAKKPVCCFGTWRDIPGVVPVTSPQEAMEFVVRNGGGENAQH